MQRVAYRCALCAQSLPEGATVPGCHQCGEIYHPHCIKGGRFCNCGVPIEAAAWVLEFDPHSAQQTPRQVFYREWQPEKGFVDLFRFGGPMPRSRYRSINGPNLMVLTFLALVTALQVFNSEPGEAIGILALCGLWAAAFLWIATASNVRRWRELGWGAAWVILDLIPVVGLLSFLYKSHVQGDSDRP